MGFSVDWFSHNIPTWQAHLECFRDKPMYGIEIGCFEGRATKWLMENIFIHRKAYLTCIDTFEGSMEHEGTDLTNLQSVFEENTKEFRDKIYVIKGKSQEVLRDEAFRPGDYNFVYIDGSHAAADVLEDAVLTFRLLAPGGIMVFDDYDWIEYRGTLNHPKPAIDAFLDIYRDKIEVKSVGYQVIIGKI